MSNELIKEAYDHFEGVWPYGEKDVIILSLGTPSVYGIYNGSRETFDRDPHGEKYWQWVGTKADFDAYGESLKEEWRPEVGQECEVSWGSPPCFWEPTVYMGSYFFSKVDEDQFKKINTRNLENLRFRPLQPKTEKEMTLESVLRIVKDADDIKHACEMLIEAGVIDKSALYL